MLMVLKQLVRDSQNLESVRDSSTIGEKQKARASRSQNDEMDVENSSNSITGGNSVLELPEASFIERVCHFYKTTLFPTRTVQYMLDVFRFNDNSRKQQEVQPSESRQLVTLPVDSSTPSFSALRVLFVAMNALELFALVSFEIFSLYSANPFSLFNKFPLFINMHYFALLFLF